jgi:hypothetical protein
MADFIQPKALFSRRIENASINPGLKKIWAETIEKWKLEKWEDVLLYQFSCFLKNIDQKEGPEIYSGQDEEAYLLNQSEIENINPIEEVVNDPAMHRSILRTFYYCQNWGAKNLGLSLKRSIEKNILADQHGLHLDADTLSFYKNIAAMATGHYFYSLTEAEQVKTFIGDQSLLMWQLGFNFQELIKDAVQEYVSLESRKEYCVIIASLLAANDTFIGRDRQQKLVTVKYWIDNYRIFSKGNFGGGDLLNFLNNKDYIEQCSGDEKELIRQILEFYPQLINGFLMIPEMEPARLNQLADNLAKIPGDLDDAPDDFSFRFQPHGWEVLFSAPLNEAAQEALLDWLKDQDPKEVREVFKKEFAAINWQEEPYMSNFLMLSELFEKVFGESAAPLIYFDEQQGKFVWGD